MEYDLNSNRFIWQDSPKSRLKAWRDFRKNIANEDRLEALKYCAEWWSSVPIGARNIDPYSPDTWPTAWELVYYNNFCEHSRGVGMYYTLWYADIKDVEIHLVNCSEKCDLLTLIVVDKTWVLNYNWATVDEYESIKNKLTLVEKFSGVPVNQVVLKQEHTVKY